MGSRLTGAMPWHTRVNTPPVEEDQGHVSLKGISVIKKVNLPVTPVVKKVKPVFVPKIEGVVKNPEDKVNPEGSTTLPRVEIA